MSFTITIHSGSRQGVKDIQVARRDQAIEAVYQSAIDTAIITSNTVAMDTGLMRELWDSALRNIRLEVRREGVTIDQESLMNFLADSGMPYTRHHIRQHSEFNPNFSSGYAMPSTGGTSPIDMNEVMSIFEERIEANLAPAGRKQGLRIVSSGMSSIGKVGAIIGGLIAAGAILTGADDE